MVVVAHTFKAFGPRTPSQGPDGPSFPPVPYKEPVGECDDRISSNYSRTTDFHAPFGLRTPLGDALWLRG